MDGWASARHRQG